MQNPFKKQQPMQTRQQSVAPKKKSCIIKRRGTGDDVKLEIGPDCKPEHIDAYMRGEEERLQRRKNREEY